MTNTPTVTLDKRYYHLQDDMKRWCEETFKTPTVWIHGRPERFPPDAAWAIDSMFGTTYFYFQREADAAWFTMKWL